MAGGAPGTGWATKPPAGSQVDFGHPMAHRLAGAWLLNEKGGLVVQNMGYTGQLNSGTLGAGPTSWVGGIGGGGVDFDGVSTKISCQTNAAVANIEPFSIVALLDADSLGELSEGFIFAKANAASPVGFWALKMSATATFQFTKSYATTNLNRVASNSTLSFNALTQVAMTWDGTDTASTAVHLYKNGIETGYKTTTNGVGAHNDDSTYQLCIGNNTGGTRTFDGRIFYVYFWTRALQPQEILSVYTNPFQMFAPNRDRLYALQSPVAESLTVDKWHPETELPQRGRFEVVAY